MSFPRCPAYKNSGAERFGSLPEHWAIVRLKNVLLQRITDGPHTTPVFEDDGVPFLSVDGIQDGELQFDGCRFISARDHEEYRKKALPRRDDLLMGKAASTGKIARVKVDFEFSIWSPLALIRVDQATTWPAFIEYALKCPIAQAQIDDLCTSNTQKNISMDDIPRLMLARPPLSEQVTIAAFLDRETAKIDALVEEQRCLIELLKEKRQAVISQAVTKGLDPNVPMKDSGVEWLGKVPAHWGLGGLTRFIGPVVDYRGRTPTKVDEGVFLVTARNIRNGKIDYTASEEYVDAESAESLLDRGRPEIGDVLFTMEAPLGQVALIDRVDIALAQRIVKFRGRQGVLHCNFLLYWFMGDHCQARLTTLATGSTALGIKASKLGMIECLLPPLEEQAEIVQYVEREIEALDALVEQAQVASALLLERRSALISAAVTGKIDVRNLVQQQEAMAA